MKATCSWLAVVLVAGAAAATADAGPPRPYIPQAPDACSPGYYVTNPYGARYGPNYYLVPPVAPYVAPPCPPCPPPGAGPGGPGAPVFATHPFARSPRDFFMLE